MRGAWLACAALAILGATEAAAEPMFLSRQYARCATCHFSTTGGGLLTPYGRSLSREELSTTGASPSGQPAGREHEFMWGLFGDSLGSVSLGLDFRPSHLDFDFEGEGSTRDLLMNADVTAAWRKGDWTLYGEFGRQPRGDDAEYASFEHWVAYKNERGFGLRAGRFLPAYGVRFADHTSFNRAPMGFDNEDQVYGVELSHAGRRSLLQVTLGPGRADALIDDDGSASFTASARAQFDLKPRVVAVVSGIYRGESDVEPSGGSAGLALGFAPTSRLSLWGEADARFRDGSSSAYTLVAEAAFEVYRGVWLKLTPQIRNELGESSAGVVRWGASLDLLPRTHWNVVLSYYHDRDRLSDLSFRTLLAQLHVYP